MKFCKSNTILRFLPFFIFSIQLQGQIIYNEDDWSPKSERNIEKVSPPVNSGNFNNDGILKYRRSSLSMVLIESDDFPNKEDVINSWNKYPFPDKYNEHQIELSSINIESITLSENDYKKAGFYNDTLTNVLQITKASASLKPLRYLNPQQTIAVITATEKQEFQIKLDKAIKEQKVAKQLVSSWYNRDKDGKFNMELVQDRGFYNASELEANIAKGQIRGTAALGDAGEELIKNTFVTFTKLEFISNEPVAAAVRESARETVYETMQGGGIIMEKALEKIEKVYEKTKEGYILISKTWLYQLNWNDSIASVFYNDLWSNPIAYDESDIFSLELIGLQNNRSLVVFKIGEKRTPEEIIDLSLFRNMDNVFAKLQKENDVFKPLVPVLSINPIMAQIGKKEGLEGGEKFDLLERFLNYKTGYTEYRNVGSVTVLKNQVWDNRFYAGFNEEGEEEDLESTNLNGSFFKGGKNVTPGMLLRLSK